MLFEHHCRVGIKKRYVAFYAVIIEKFDVLGEFFEPFVVRKQIAFVKMQSLSAGCGGVINSANRSAFGYLSGRLKGEIAAVKAAGRSNPVGDYKVLFEMRVLIGYANAREVLRACLALCGKFRCMAGLSLASGAKI